MMDLIDNYLGAVRWNLPAAKADDIMAELADALANRIEEREEILGRPLSRDEISAVLKQFGHPLEVAGRYHGQRVLIGPEVFPFYWFILRIVLVVVVAIKAIEVGADAITNGQHWVRALIQSGGHLFDSLLINAAIVTLIFAVVEHSGLLAHYLETWKPEQLPRLRMQPMARRKRWDAAFQIVFGLGFILWWVGVIHIPVIQDDPRFTIEPAGVWTTIFWPVLIFAVARLVYLALSWSRPDWRLPRALLSIATTIGAIWILSTLYHAGPWVTVTPHGMSAAKAAEVAESVNLSVRIGLIGVGIGLGWRCFQDLWEIYRR